MPDCPATCEYLRRYPVCGTVSEPYCDRFDTDLTTTEGQPQRLPECEHENEGYHKR